MRDREQIEAMDKSVVRRMHFVSGWFVEIVRNGADLLHVAMCVAHFYFGENICCFACQYENEELALLSIARETNKHP